MPSIEKSGTFTLGDRIVKRLGYGAMQLAGPGVFGPPKDHAAALAVLREAVASGVDHIDTSDFYGPHVTNQIIREALSPYRDDLVIVTKISARRGADGSWIPAFSREELTQAVHDNLRNLGREVLDVVNLRAMFDVHHPAEGSLEAPLTVLADLQRQLVNGALHAATGHTADDLVVAGGRDGKRSARVPGSAAVRTRDRGQAERLAGLPPLGDPGQDVTHARHLGCKCLISGNRPYRRAYSRHEMTAAARRALPIIAASAPEGYPPTRGKSSSATLVPEMARRFT